MIDASASTAGPYGESWSLLVTSDGRAFFEYGHSIVPIGSVSGRFFVDPAAVKRIQEQAKSTQFADLPQSLEPRPVPMHAPDYRLKLRIDEKMHSKRLYAPKEVEDAASMTRFRTVWAKVWDLVPLRPQQP